MSSEWYVTIRCSRLTIPSTHIQRRNVYRQMKVLVIDDDMALCELIQSMLARSGVETITVQDGEAGLDLIKANDFDVIILDVMLGDANGFDVLQRLRITCDVPVIMLTAKGDERDRIRGLELGADDYVPKPSVPTSY